MIDGGLVHKERHEFRALDTAVSIEPGKLSFTCSSWPADWFSRFAGPNAAMVFGLELIKQAVTATAHLHYRVTRDPAFVMHEIGLEVQSEPDSLLDTRELRLDLQVNRVLYRNRGTPRALNASIAITRADETLAQGHGHLGLIPAPTYARVRGQRAGLKTPGRSPCSIHALVAGNPLPLRFPTNADNEYVFDHPVDHVPGMMLLAGALDLHDRIHPKMARAVEASFKGYAEFSDQIVLAMKPCQLSDGEIHAEQSGTRLATIDIR